jgi:hypothetical protein
MGFDPRSAWSSEVAKRMLAGGANALALDADPGHAEGIGRETANWLEVRTVVLGIKGAREARGVAAFLRCLPGSTHTLTLGPGEAGGRVQCLVTAPWTVISLVTLAFFEDIVGMTFPESFAEGRLTT